MGIGWRRELRVPLRNSPELVDFVEVVAESCFADPEQRREAIAISEQWPVVPHGVKLSLGSADGIDPERARRLGSLARELTSPVISEHVAFTRGGAREIGHLTQLPLTRAAVSVLARNVGAARRHFPDVPLLLENAAWTLRWPDDEMDEGSFYHQVVEATSCDLLLDLGNVYANALNSGRDPHDLLRSYPLERVAMVHIAGGALRNGLYVDTHCHAVPPEVFRLLEALVQTIGPRPVLLERDGRFPPFLELVGELATSRSLLRRHAGDGKPRPALPPKHTTPEAKKESDSGVLLSQQTRLAELLTAAECAADPAPFDAKQLEDSRSVLHHKRVDEALSLLPRLAAQWQDVHPIALACIAGRARAERGGTVLDALAVAESAQERFGSAAYYDGLALRTRFSFGQAGPAARLLPAMERRILPTGERILAAKGFGRAAPIRFYPSYSQPRAIGGSHGSNP